MSESNEDLKETRRAFAWSTAGLVAFYLLLAWPAVATRNVGTWTSLFAMSLAGMVLLYFYEKRRGGFTRNDDGRS